MKIKDIFLFFLFLFFDHVIKTVGTVFHSDPGGVVCPVIFCTDAPGDSVFRFA